MSDNDSVIREICYDKDDGFDRAAETYRNAHNVLNAIVVASVKAFIETQKKGP